MKTLFLLLLLVPACAGSAETADNCPKVYADVADCPQDWQDCAANAGHTGLDSEPSEGLTHWVASCGDKNLECLVTLDVPRAALNDAAKECR